MQNYPQLVSDLQHSQANDVSCGLDFCIALSQTVERVDLTDKTSYYANLHNLKSKNQVESCQKQEIDEMTLRNYNLEAKNKQLQSQLAIYEKERQELIV